MLLFLPSSVFAETLKINVLGKYYALVEQPFDLPEDIPTNTPGERVVYFDDAKFYELFYGQFDYDEEGSTLLGSNPMNAFLKAGTEDDVQYFVYVLFSLDDIPKPDYMTDVFIESVKVKALIQQIPNHTQEKTFVTISSCFRDYWLVSLKEKFESHQGPPGPIYINESYHVFYNFETEETESICSVFNAAEDSVVVDTDDLPQNYVWDVTSAVIEARKNGYQEVTFVISADTVSEEMIFFRSEVPPTLVRFSSPDEAVHRFIGFNAVPSFSVTYTTMPSQLNETLQFATVIVLPTLAVLVPSMIWFFKKIKKVTTE